MRRVNLVRLAALLFPAIALAQTPTYAITDLGPAIYGLQWAPIQPLYLGGADSVLTYFGSLGGNVTEVYMWNGTAMWNGTEAVGDSALATSNCGNLVTHAFLWTAASSGPGGTMQDLGTLPGGTCISSAIAFDGDTIVGWSQSLDCACAGTVVAQGGFQQAVEWVNGKITVLPGFLNPYVGTNQHYATGQDATSEANAVDSSGEVVGWSTQLLGTGQLAQRAVVWENGTPLELQYQLGGASGSVILTTATGINCQGNIAATGYVVNTSSTDIHSYLLVRQGASRSCPQ